MDPRHYHVQGLTSWLGFYRLVCDGFEVLRSAHGARDIETVLATEITAQGRGEEGQNG